MYCIYYTYYILHILYMLYTIQMCFIYIGNIPMTACRWNLALYADHADLERFLI